MSLSHRERRILAEIELQISRDDPAFAARDDWRLTPPRHGPHRFSHHVSRREVVWVLVTALVVMVALPVLVLVAVSGQCSPGDTAPPTAITGEAATASPSHQRPQQRARTC
ncbi:DUF3040 domain-containing protein [Nonomuraea indica]|uniref:DUF3040 domain-containing protein n=1 Tax=Nonomuraea indica TaxID=1581193 RepID=A0ABW8ADQ9_9ACTN